MYHNCDEQVDIYKYCKNHTDNLAIVNTIKKYVMYVDIDKIDIENIDIENIDPDIITDSVVYVQTEYIPNITDRKCIYWGIIYGDKCIADNCEKTAIYNSTYCVYHTCPKCNDYKDIQQEACPQDICQFVNCESVRWDGEYCFKHSCLVCNGPCSYSKICTICNRCDCDIGKLGITEKIKHGYYDDITCIEKYHMYQYDGCNACICKRCRCNRGNIYSKDFSVTVENITIKNIVNDCIRLCDKCAELYPVKKIYEKYPNTVTHKSFHQVSRLYPKHFNWCKICGRKENIVDDICPYCKLCECSFGKAGILYVSTSDKLDKSCKKYCICTIPVMYDSCISCKCIMCNNNGEIYVPYYAKYIKQDQMYILLDNMCVLCDSHYSDIFISINDVQIDI